MTWKGSISTPDLIKILYDAVADPAELKNQNGEIIDVSKSSASNILNLKGNVREDICKHSQDQVVLDSIHSYFNTHIINNLNPLLHYRLIQQLENAINNDEEMLDEEKNSLLTNADTNHLTDFLVESFLYSLSVPNKAKTNRSDNQSGVKGFKENASSVKGIITFDTCYHKKMSLSEAKSYIKERIYKAINEILNTCTSLKQKTNILQSYLKIIDKAIDEKDEDTLKKYDPLLHKQFYEIQDVMKELLYQHGRFYTEFGNIIEINNISHAEFSTPFIAPDGTLGRIAGTETDSYIKALKDLTENYLL